MALPGTGDGVRAYPALVDEGGAVGVVDHGHARRAGRGDARGRPPAAALTVPSPVRFVQDRLPLGAQLALAGAPYAGPAAVLEDATAAAIDALVDEAGGPAWDEAGFARCAITWRASWRTAPPPSPRRSSRVLDLAREVRGRLDALSAEPFEGARRDVRRQLDGLVHAGFVAEAGAARLPDVERYLRGGGAAPGAAARRAGGRRDRLAVVGELQDLLDARLAAWPAGRAPSPELLEVRWLLRGAADLPLRPGARDTPHGGAGLRQAHPPPARGRGRARGRTRRLGLRRLPAHPRARRGAGRRRHRPALGPRDVRPPADLLLVGPGRARPGREHTHAAVGHLPISIGSPAGSCSSTRTRGRPGRARPAAWSGGRACAGLARRGLRRAGARLDRAAAGARGPRAAPGRRTRRARHLARRVRRPQRAAVDRDGRLRAGRRPPRGPPGPGRRWGSRCGDRGRLAAAVRGPELRAGRRRHRPARRGPGPRQRVALTGGQGAAGRRRHPGDGDVHDRHPGRRRPGRDAGRTARGRLRRMARLAGRAGDPARGGRGVLAAAGRPPDRARAPRRAPGSRRASRPGPAAAAPGRDAGLHELRLLRGRGLAVGRSRGCGLEHRGGRRCARTDGRGLDPLDRSSSGCSATGSAAAGAGSPGDCARCCSAWSG